MSRHVVIFSSVRTAISTFTNSLKDRSPTELGVRVVRASFTRAGVEGKYVGHVLFGQVANTEFKDLQLLRRGHLWCGIRWLELLRASAVALVKVRQIH